LFETNENSLDWSQLIKDSHGYDEYCTSIHERLAAEDLATIIYTSGTTGNPKGVMLSHKNISSNVNRCIQFFTMCDENGKALSFLPLNHILEKMVMYIYVKKGITVYFAEDLGKVGDNLREVKPDLFTTVPRLLEKVYEKIMEKGNALTGMKKKIFFWALGIAERYELKGNGFFYNIQRSIADKLVYTKWREAVGGNVKAIITGGAACQLRLQKIFTCAQLVVMEGYGLTETSPVMSINTYEVEGRSFGTIGIPIPGQEVKIAEDGEIMAKGDHVMMGYYKNQAATDEVLNDGWFATGDIGKWIDHKYLKITDRKKELFKLSAGKYIAPQALEGKLKESPYIEQVMVMGADEKYVGALIVPNINNLKSYLSTQGIDIQDPQEIISHELSQKLIKKEVNSLNQSFADYEQIKKFQLLPQEWTIDTGELTPKLSLKRKVIADKYRELISKLF
jgi:long-chain acyl-CoA synthetase